jgi:hypothetical protein
MSAKEVVASITDKTQFSWPVLLVVAAAVGVFTVTQGRVSAAEEKATAAAVDAKKALDQNADQNTRLALVEKAVVSLERIAQRMDEHVSSDQKTAKK